MRKFACPCCGFLTLTDRSYWSFEICPVCFWENDPLQEEDPLYWGGANGISITEGRKNFGRCGASHPDEVLRVRAPGIEEVPVGPRMTKAQVHSIARGILSGEIPLRDGCRALASCSFSAAEEPELFRLLWIFGALAEEAEPSRYRGEIENACGALEEHLRPQFDA